VDTTLIKQRTKQILRRTVGEPYVGKRFKMRRLGSTFDGLALKPTAILDAGAEDATFVYWLADRYPAATVTAVDIDAGAIAACIAARPSGYASRVDFRVSYFADLEPESFDLITAFDVLEHIEDDAGAVRDLARALRPGGSLLVHVPSGTWVNSDGSQVVVSDEEAAVIHSGHVRSGYSPQAMRALLEGTGLDVRRSEPWMGRWGAKAHAFYSRVEHPAPLRVLSLAVTDVCARMDMREDKAVGSTVFAHAIKRS
jgi:SAM-dependent methyltransferase